MCGLVEVFGTKFLQDDQLTLSFKQCYAQHFFLQVQNRDADPDDDFVYSDMYDDTLPLGAGLTLEAVVAKLAELEIEPPPALVEDLASDQRLNIGNLVIRYGHVEPKQGV